MTTEIIIITILCGVVSSLIFLFVILVFLRPTIKIGKCIANHIDENGDMCYRFKFINKSVFSCYDAYIELYENNEVPAEPKGKDVIPKKVPLTSDRYTYIHRYAPSWTVKNYAHHCIQVRTLVNLEPILKDPHKTLQLRVTLRHGLSGLSKNFIKDYNTDRTIKHGEFNFGNSFEIS